MATANKFNGVLDDQRINAEDISVDATPFPRRIKIWLTVPNNVVMLLMVLAAASVIYAPFGGWFFFFGLGLTLWGTRQKESSPLKLPIQAQTLDPNEPDLSTGAPTQSNGIFFLGNDLRTGKEIWLTNSDCRQHFLILGTTGAGKSLPVDARVHTPSGWRRMGDLRVGDFVSTPDGQSAPVIGYYPQGVLSICRLTFADGRTAEACPLHLWKVYSQKGVSYGVMTTRELAALPMGAFAIPLPQPVEKPHAHLTIDPYVIGQMMATIGMVNRSSYAVLVDIARVVRAANHGAAKTIDPTLASIDPAVAISDLYKETSIAQRWALIRGLMDSQGRCEADGCLTFFSLSEPLVRWVQELVWSLGGTARFEGPDEQTSCKLVIGHAAPANFFSDPMALSTEDPSVDGVHRFLAITKIEMDIRQEEAACILIDHPDHLFITDNYVVTHNTEALLGFAANALSWGSGLLFCDGKGDVALFAKVYAMARRFGREDDLLVLNFMTGNRDPSAAGGKILSNTLNPFSTGSSDALTQMMTSLLDSAGGDAMWQGRAIALLTGIMRALCWLRDQGYMDLNVSQLRDHMNLRKIIELANPNMHPDLPPHIRKSIQSYLSSLPGYVEEKGTKQAQTTLDQHGYLEMQFTKILSSLVDVYGHIFATPQGEIDMYDVVLSRRILVIMLPALEKAPTEIANLGKIVVATLKDMMASTLGSEIEGTWTDVVDNRPTSSPSPFVVVMDEVGYYTVEGMALMAAQARSLGFALVFAAQDTNSMEKLNEKEAHSIIANTNTKIFMKTEDPNKTTDLAVKRGFKALRSRSGGHERRTGEIGGNYFVENDNASFQDSDVIDGADLAGQLSGEMHVTNGKRVIRAKSFYAQPDGTLDVKKLNLRANYFIKVARPNRDAIMVGIRGPEISQILVDGEAIANRKSAVKAAILGIGQPRDTVDEIASATEIFNAMLEKGRSKVEASCAVVADMSRVLSPTVGALNADVRNSYATSVPLASPSFDLDDDDDIDDLGPMNTSRGGSDLGARAPVFDMAEDDPFATPGVPILAKSQPPFAPGKFPKKPTGPRKPQKVDGTVRHGVTVDEKRTIDMADKIAADNAIMATLAVLDFDSDTTTSSDVESRMEKAIGGLASETAWSPSTASAVEGDVSAKVEAFDRATTGLAQPSIFEDTETGDDGGDSDGGDVEAFLKGLLEKDD